MTTKVNETKSNQVKSKMHVAKEIYRKNKEKPHKELMKLFMEKAHLTKAGSSTYINNIRKLDKEGKLYNKTISILT